MRRVLVALGSGAVVCIVAAAPASMQSPTPAGAAVATPVAPSPAITVSNLPDTAVTPEEARALAARVAPKLSEIRQRLAAQIAVRDAVEGWRAPSADELAALTPTVADTGATVKTLPGGGQVLRTDASQLSALVATVEGGVVTVRHADGTPVKGGHRDH
ncbi:hypothetical protein [Luteitalea sp.]|uniref:hypothetical protein n=1 Tax=Luteitalea sp. TaxID=2004800 RepID=UPI0025C66680|nr:hypothetical protein [Luteitalea sp.]